MPTRVGRPCGAPGCPAVVRGGRYCPAHAPLERKPDARESSNRRGYDATWRKIRARVLRERPLCVECMRVGVVTAANEVDHIIPLRDGGTHDDENLQPLCKSCHSKKTRREMTGPSKSLAG
jgi:5-methylcytosine-specific restriction protein A